MAERMGYSKSFIGRIEADKSAKVDLKITLMICRTFDVNYDYLVFGEGSMFKQTDAKKRAMMDIYDDLSSTYQKNLYDYFVFLSERSSEEK